MTTAKDIMTKKVSTISACACIDELTSLLASKHISGVPVVDESKKVVGIVTEADVLTKKEGACTVGDIMTKKVVSVSPSTEVHEVAQVLAKRKIKRVPVMDNSKLVGVVSRADLVKAMANE